MAYGNYLLPWNLNHIAKGHVAETQAKNVCRIFAMRSKKAKPHRGISSFPNRYTLNTIANRVDPIMRETARGIALTSVYDEMFPHAELMIHDPLIQNAGGSALSVQETSRRLMGLRRTLSQILADRSGLSVKRVQSLTAKDTFLTAERAVELGFADAIVEPRKAA